MNVGLEVRHENKPALVVRKVSSESLFEDQFGNCTLIKETYNELIQQDGTVIFVTESCTTEKTAKDSKIRGLDPQIWRPRHATQVSPDGSEVVG